MESLDDFEEFLKNYVEVSSSTVSTSFSHVPIVQAQSSSSNIIAPKQINATVACGKAHNPTLSSTTVSTSSISSKMKPTSSTENINGSPSTSKFNQDNKRVSSTTAMSTVKRPVPQVTSSQEPQKKIKLGDGVSKVASLTAIAPHNNLALNSNKTSVQNTILLQATPPSSSMVRKSVIVSPSASTTICTTNPIIAALPKTSAVPSTKPTISPSIKPAIAPQSKPAAIPSLQNSTTSASQTVTASSTPLLRQIPTTPSNIRQIIALTPAILQSLPLPISRALSQGIQFPFPLTFPPPSPGSLAISQSNYIALASASTNSTTNRMLLLSRITPLTNTLPRPATNLTTPAFQHVTQKAYEVLKLISPSQFTDAFLEAGFFKADKIEPQQPEYSNILEYVNNSQAHQRFGMELISVLKIIRPSTPNTSPSTLTVTSANLNSELTSQNNRFTMMLWHGTRPRNVANILKNGFKCPQTGTQMFGKGVYFADRISKSAQYCNQNVYCAVPKPGEIGYLFLSEVTLGKCYNAKNVQKTNISTPTATRHDGSVLTFDSLKCTGENIPDRQQQKEIDGIIWPLGRTIKNTRFPTYTVLYNEFIVYNPEMVKIRYLVKVQFK